jgi:hypothetical protein
VFKCPVSRVTGQVVPGETVQGMAVSRPMKDYKIGQTVIAQLSGPVDPLRILQCRKNPNTSNHLRVVLISKLVLY